MQILCCGLFAFWNKKKYVSCRPFQAKPNIELRMSGQLKIGSIEQLTNEMQSLPKMNDPDRIKTADDNFLFCLVIPYTECSFVQKIILSIVSIIARKLD